MEFLLLLTVPVMDPDKEDGNWKRPLNCLHLVISPLFLVLTLQSGACEYPLPQASPPPSSPYSRVFFSATPGDPGPEGQSWHLMCACAMKDTSLPQSLGPGPLAPHGDWTLVALGPSAVLWLVPLPYTICRLQVKIQAWASQEGLGHIPKSKIGWS